MFRQMLPARSDWTQPELRAGGTHDTRLLCRVGTGDTRNCRPRACPYTSCITSWWQWGEILVPVF